MQCQECGTEMSSDELRDLLEEGYAECPTCGSEDWI